LLDQQREIQRLQTWNGGEEDLTKRAQSSSGDASNRTASCDRGSQIYCRLHNTSLQSSAHNDRKNGRSRPFIVFARPAPRPRGPDHRAQDALAVTLRANTKRSVEKSLSFYWYVSLFLYMCNFVSCSAADGHTPQVSKSPANLPRSSLNGSTHPLLLLQELLTHRWK
jgi:hypothetical protein